MRPITTSLLTLSAGVAVFQGCASTPGARPQDMSATQHEQAAGVHETQAENSQTRCAGSDVGSGPCWTDMTNPSREHFPEVERHRKMAADHRAAAQSLRDAEAHSCAGLSNDDRDMSPFAHREDIRRSESLSVVHDNSVQYTAPSYVHVSGKNPGDHLAGATVFFRAVPGLTAEYLQRVINCHIARNNALGNDVPEMAYCPLTLKGVSATVKSASDGFAVDITAQNDATAREILRRAEALPTRP
jgi:hypothetical protein